MSRRRIGRRAAGGSGADDACSSWCEGRGTSCSNGRCSCSCSCSSFGWMPSSGSWSTNRSPTAAGGGIKLKGPKDIGCCLVWVRSRLKLWKLCPQSYNLISIKLIKMSCVVEAAKHSPQPSVWGENSQKTSWTPRKTSADTSYS